MAHEKPIVVHDEHYYNSTTTSSPVLPEFVGEVRDINFATGKGLPKHLTNTEKAAIFRAIKTGTTNINSDAVGTATIKAVLWHCPFRIDNYLAVTLTNTCVSYCVLSQSFTIDRAVQM
jgi:hypothetical protein